MNNQITPQEIIESFVSILHDVVNTLKDLEKMNKEEYIQLTVMAMNGLRKHNTQIKEFYEKYPKDMVSSVIPDSFIDQLNNLMSCLNNKQENNGNLSVITQRINAINIEDDMIDSVLEFPETN